MPKSRKATHSGSWYDNNGEQLASSIQQWVEAAKGEVGELLGEDAGSVKAVIGPHAGYRYCGHVQGYAYSVLSMLQRPPSRVILLGPSHHFYSEACLLTGAATCDTPLGPLPLDMEVIAELRASGQFKELSSQQDEDEHSLELHLPFLKYLHRLHPFLLVPIMVGAVGRQRDAAYGQLLAPYLSQPDTLFVVSSDFCHWGSRFRYRPMPQEPHVPIWQHIQQLDEQGVEAIKKVTPAPFYDYLAATSNTVCGRHPISLLLNIIEQAGVGMQVHMLKYDQS